MAAPLRLLLRRAGPLALLLVLLQYCPLAVDSMEDGLARKPPRGFRTWNCFVRKTHLCLSCLLTGSNDRWRRRWLATVLLPAVPHRDCAAWWLGLTACWPLLAAVCCLLPACLLLCCPMIGTDCLLAWLLAGVCRMLCLLLMGTGAVYFERQAPCGC